MYVPLFNEESLTLRVFSFAVVVTVGDDCLHVLTPLDVMSKSCRMMTMNAYCATCIV